MIDHPDYQRNLSDAKYNNYRRLLGAKSSDKTAPTVNPMKIISIREEGNMTITEYYDENGNVKTLYRTHFDKEDK